MCAMQNTYEETLINAANQKSGLNEAVLGNIGGSGDPEKNAARIARLLREGAHSLVDERAANAASDAFQQQVLLAFARSKTLQLCCSSLMSAPAAAKLHGSCACS